MAVVLAAGPNSGLSKLLLLLHIVTIVAAFAPLFVQPVLVRQLGASRRGDIPAVMGSLLRSNQRIHAPSLILAGFFGILLIAASDDVWKFSQGWVSLSFLVWIAMNGVLHGVQLPAQRKLAKGDRSMQQRVDLADGLLGLLFLVMVVLMIWKPGV
jgi:uncharacterized membrane protein